MNTIPHLRIVVVACLMAIAGYAVFSTWAVFYSADPALRGDVIGTWKSFAVAAFTFWIGSSSAGKSRDTDIPTGKKNDPVAVNVEEPK